MESGKEQKKNSNITNGRQNKFKNFDITTENKNFANKNNVAIEELAKEYKSNLTIDLDMMTRQAVLDPLRISWLDSGGSCNTG